MHAQVWTQVSTFRKLHKSEAIKDYETLAQRAKQLQAQRRGKQVPALPARDAREAGRRLGSHLPHSTSAL